MNNIKEEIKNEINSEIGTIKPNFKLTYSIEYSDFVELIIKQACYYQAKTNKNVGYVIDSTNEVLIKKLHKHLTDKNARKGFFVFGTNGTGKTLLMLSYMAICQRIAERTLQPVHKFFVASKLIDIIQKGESTGGVLCIDELGREEVTVNNYGTKSYPILDLLAERYEKGVITHAVSNFRIDDLKAKYGNYIIDRFNEMFEFIEIKGESKRK